MAQISFNEMAEKKADFEVFLRVERKMKENTISAYLRDIDNFFCFCLKNGFSDEEKLKEGFEEFTDSLKKEGKSPSTVSRNIASVRKFFRYLKDLDFIGKNPTKGMAYEKKTAESEDTEILSTDEIDRLIDSVKSESIKGYRDEAILETLYACGLKASELINLKISDISLSGGYIYIDSAPKRYIPLYKGAIKAIKIYIAKGRKYLTSDKKNDILFLNKDGQPLTRQGLWKMLKAFGKKAKIAKEITPHLIRKSMAMHLLENGADIYDVQAILGHKNINLTKSYLKNFHPSVMRAYEKAHPKA